MMGGFLEVLLSAYDVNIKSVQQLRGGVKLLDLFSFPSTDSPQGNFRRLKDHLRTYFPQVESALSVTKCVQGENSELRYAAALSLGALIAQDLSKASMSSRQTFSDRLRNLCAYQGAEVESIKEFCEIVFKDDDVPAKVRTMVESLVDQSENENSTSSGSSFNSSVTSAHNRTPLSPLNAVLRTPENRRRVRERYSHEVVKLRGDLLIMRERYDQLEADVKQQAEAKEREVKELQNRVRVLRTLIEADSQQEKRNNESSVKHEISQGRLKMLQKQIQQLQEYEQKFFDEKLRAEQLETKLLQDEKKIKDLKARIQALEAAIIEKDQEISQAADEMGALRDRIDEQRVDNSFVRHRNQSLDTLDSVIGGENMGDVVQDLVLAELKSDNDDLRKQLEFAKDELSTKHVEVADLQLSNQMKKEQIAELETEVDALRSQIRLHLETITQAANQANELSSKLQLAQSECERLQSELSTVTESKQKLEERRKYLENKVQLLKGQIEEAQERFIDMDHIKGLVEEQLKSQSTLIEDLRTQIAEKTARILAVEAELSKATTNFTDTVKSINVQLADDRKSHLEERSKLERRVELLENDLAEANRELKTLHVELEQLKIERAEINTQLNIHLECRSKTQNELLALEKKLCLEEEAKTSFEVSFRQAMDEIGVLKCSNEQLRSEVDQCRESEKSAKQQLENEQQSLTASQQSVTLLEEENRNLKKTYIASSTQLQEIKDTHEKCSEQQESLNKRNEELESSLKDKCEEIRTLQSTIGDLKESLSTEASDKQFMQQALAEATETISENDKVIGTLKVNIAELENSIDRLTEQVALKTLELAESNKELAECTARFEKDSKVLVDQYQEQIKLVEEAQQQRQTAEERLKSTEERNESEFVKLKAANDCYKSQLDKIQAEDKDRQARLLELEAQLEISNHELDRKSVRLAEVEKIIDESDRKLDDCEKTHEQIINAQLKQISALEESENAIKMEINSLRQRSLEDEAEIVQLTERLDAVEQERAHYNSKISDLEGELDSTRSSFLEAVLESKDLPDDYEDTPDGIERLNAKYKLEVLTKSRLATELDDLKTEYDKVLAEVAELRNSVNKDDTAEVVKWKQFRKSLVNKLEHFDVQAPVMNEDQLLGVIDKSLENQKKLKELQVQNQNLTRLVRNAEDNGKCRIMDLTAENDQCKRKLRELSLELDHRQAELREITTTVIRAKAGDTVDGEILSPLSRDIMNMAVACQESSTTAKEVRQLRLMLRETRRDKERFDFELNRLKTIESEFTLVKMERDELKQENMRYKNISEEGYQSVELIRESYDQKVERIRDELQRSKLELRKTREYVSTLLDKYDKLKESNLRKIAALHEYMYQKNVPLPKLRRKSPNQSGVPAAPRPSQVYSDDSERTIRDKDEEIRRLRMVKKDLERRVSALLVQDHGRTSISSAKFVAPLFVDSERQKMPPPLPPAGDSFQERYTLAYDRAWRDFRDPNIFSASNCSDYDSFSVKSMPTYRRQEADPMQRSFSSRSLLFDHDSNQFGQKPQALCSTRTSSNCLHRGASCLSVCKFVPQEEDFPTPAAMYDKPLPATEDLGTSNAFESIGDLNYKCDLDASCASSRGGRSAGLGGLGLGDDEEAQFMNPKNLEDLKNDEPSSPTDPNRGSELKQRNSQLPPHLQSSYPVETQNGKIPVTPLLQKKRFH